MSTLTIRLPDDQHERLRALALLDKLDGAEASDSQTLRPLTPPPP